MKSPDRKETMTDIPAVSGVSSDAVKLAKRQIPALILQSRSLEIRANAFGIPTERITIAREKARYELYQGKSEQSLLTAALNLRVAVSELIAEVDSWAELVAK